MCMNDNSIYFLDISHMDSLPAQMEDHRLTSMHLGWIHGYLKHLWLSWVFS